MKKILTHLIIISMFVLVLGASTHVAQVFAVGDVSATNLIVCDGGKDDPCTFNKLIELANHAFNFAVYKVGLPLAGIFILHAGFLYMTAGSNPSNIKSANGRLLNILAGLAIMLTAWIIVKTLLTWLGCTDCLSLLA
jgi:hypothetical protein